MADAENIPRVSYLWNFSFTLGNSFISVIHKEVTHASWKGRLSQSKMLMWASLFNIIDIKTFPTMLAYAQYQVEMCPIFSFLLPEKWATEPQSRAGWGNHATYWFPEFPQHGFLWKSYQQLCLVSQWFITVLAQDTRMMQATLGLSRKHKEHWHKALLKFQILANSLRPFQKPQRRLHILSTGKPCLLSINYCQNNNCCIC